MKIIKSLLIAFAVVCLAACSGGSSYNPSTCEELAQKIKDKQELTESDYNTMIDQFGGIVKYLKDKEAEIGDDQEKKAEFMKSEDAEKLLGYTIGFGFYLQQHEKDLSPDNVKKLKELQDELKEVE